MVGPVLTMTRNQITKASSDQLRARAALTIMLDAVDDRDLLWQVGAMKRAKLVAFEAFCMWPVWGPIVLVVVLASVIAVCSLAVWGV